MEIKLPKEILEIFYKFEKASFKIYLVGGSVRDLLMSREVNDWDFTTDAKPEEILKLFPEGHYNNKFGTVGVPSKLGVIEITTMRKEGIYKDHRHPTEVDWTDKIDEDLGRRDFTINALAMDESLKIIDPFNGQENLGDKLVKAVGNPNQRFEEDALRLLRAIRIATQLKFDVDEKTFAAIKQNASLISDIAWERIRDEILKILATDNAYEGVLKLRQTGLLQIILPELERCFGLIQEGPKHDRVYDIGEHSLLTLKETPTKDPLVKLASLLHDVGKPGTAHKDKDGNVTFYNHDLVGGEIIQRIARRFSFSNNQTEKLYKLVRFHMFTLDEKQTDSAIRRFIKNVGPENIDDMMALRVGDRLGGGTENATSWRMEKFKERIKQVLHKPFSIADLKVNGQDVMKTLKISPSPKVGQILNQLFQEVLKDSGKNTREYLLKRIKTIQ